MRLRLFDHHGGRVVAEVMLAPAAFLADGSEVRAAAERLVVPSAATWAELIDDGVVVGAGIARVEADDASF